MTQTKLGSLVEAWANIAVGFTINWCANMAILPLFGFNVSGGQAFGIGLIFTGISFARQYVLRRWFNGLKFWNKPQHDPVRVAARELRAAQRAYMADRGNDTKGRAVAEAAARLDEALA